MTSRRTRLELVSPSLDGAGGSADDGAQLALAWRCASPPISGFATADPLIATRREIAVVDGDRGRLAVVDNSREKGTS